MKLVTFVYDMKYLDWGVSLFVSFRVRLKMKERDLVSHPGVGIGNPL